MRTWAGSAEAHRLSAPQSRQKYQLGFRMLACIVQDLQFRCYGKSTEESLRKLLAKAGSVADVHFRTAGYASWYCSFGM